MPKSSQTFTVETIPGDQLTYIPEGKRQTRKIKELAETIKERGIINPLLVEVIDEKGKYLIRRGRRRYEAGKLVGLTEYPCIVVPQGSIPADLDTIENTQREPYTPHELYEQALQLHPEIKKGVSPELLQQLAGSLGLSVVETQRIMNIRLMKPEVITAMTSANLPFNLALLSLRIKNPKKIKPFLDMCAKDHPSPRVAAEYISDWQGDDTAHRSILSACFDTKACSNCPKRGHADPSLFEDPDPDAKHICWDPTCYGEKITGAMTQVLEKAKSLGLAAAAIKKGPFDSYNYMVHGLIKVADPNKCKDCKLVVVGEKERTISILCPHSCKNIKTSRNAVTEREAKPKADKPVIERSRNEKIRYMNEKLDLAARKFMINHFFTSPGNDKELRKERYPTDFKRILFYLGMDKHDNPLTLQPSGYNPSHIRVAKELEAKAKKNFDLEFVAKTAINMERCGSHLSYNDQSGRGPKNINEDVELLYGIKDFCALHYQEIIDLLGKSAKAVMESMGSWRPEWAKNAKISAPAKAGSTKKITKGVCRICGCTEKKACPGGCSWVDKTETLCSNPLCVAKARKEAKATKKK